MALPSAEPRREAALLLLAARGEAGPEARERVAQRVACAIDWNALILMADAHAMVPLLARRLEGSARVPKPVLVELCGRREKISRDARAMANALGRVLDALDAIDVPALPYKGPALASSLYGDVAMRDFCDLDILIRPRDVLRAKEALAALGYVPEYPLAAGVQGAFLRAPSQYHLGMQGPGDIVVELHWKTDADFPVERDDDAWWSGLATVRVEGRAMRAFSTRELLLVLCLHGSKHGWERLAWLADVSAILRAHDGIEWDWIFARAAALGCRRRLALGLALAHSLLGAPLPEAVLRRIESDPRVATIAREIGSSLAAGDVVFRQGVPALLFGLRLHERTRRRLALVYNAFLAPSLVEWTRWPLPRALYFLYPPLRLARLAFKYSRRTVPQGDAVPAKPA